MDDKQYQRLVERIEATIELEREQQAEKADRDRKVWNEWDRNRNRDADEQRDREEER